MWQNFVNLLSIGRSKRLYFYLIWVYFILRRPVDVTAMDVASGRSWKVCYKVTDIDSYVVREGQSEDQKQRFMFSLLQNCVLSRGHYKNYMYM